MNQETGHQVYDLIKNNSDDDVIDVICIVVAKDTFGSDKSAVYAHLADRNLIRDICLGVAEDMKGTELA